MQMQLNCCQHSISDSPAAVATAFATAFVMAIATTFAPASGLSYKSSTVPCSGPTNHQKMIALGRHQDRFLSILGCNLGGPGW